MRKFQDSSGREWEMSIDCATIGRVFDQCGVDLGDPTDGDPPLHVRLLAGMGMFLKVLPVICQTQMQARGVDPDSFLQQIPITSVNKIKDEFVSEWASFFRDSGQPTAAKVIEGMQKLQAAKRRLTPDSPELKRLEALLDTAYQGSLELATTLPESAG